MRMISVTAGLRESWELPPDPGVVIPICPTVPWLLFSPSEEEYPSRTAVYALALPPSSAS